MRIITPKHITEAMLIYPQWKVGLKLWLDVFNKKNLSFESSIHIKNIWKNNSGWNVDRIPANKLKIESKKGPLDIYIFDVHKNQCRIITWGSPKIHCFYVKGVYSHAEYDKWCKKQVK